MNEDIDSYTIIGIGILTLIFAIINPDFLNKTACGKTWNKYTSKKNIRKFEFLFGIIFIILGILVKLNIVILK